jgi:hypothetical protein
MQISDIFHNCPEQEQQQEQQQCNPKDLGSKFPRSKIPGFDPITFTFSENLNYGRESLLEV